MRKNRFVVLCDIKEILLQVEVHPEDRRFLRFLWRGEETRTMEFSIVVFCLNTSSFLAHLISRVNADGFSEKYPSAVEIIKRSTYMDDCVDSVNTEDEAVELFRQLKEIWGHAGMEVHKWA